jgi:hypothetical protein
MQYIGVTGSREFHNDKLLFDQLDKLWHEYKYITLVSGGAKGADSLARKYALLYKINIIEYFPEYEVYGKTAPFLRNKKIAEKCDILIACFRSDLPCNSTKDTVTKAAHLNKPVIYLMSTI